MTGKFAVFSLLVCLLCQYTHSRSTGLQVNAKRFFMDWFSSADFFMKAGMSELIRPECVLCKCTNRCTGESFGEMMFGIKANEKTVCGMSMWTSINCADKHNIISTPAPGQTPTQSRCNKLSSIASVAKSQSVSSPDASLCISGLRESNEAMLMNFCGLKATNTWIKGAAVMPICQTVSHYTPVAAFINDVYVPGSAGILTSCLSNGEIGFQIIRQECGHTPELVHVSKNQTANNNPDMYYVIH